MLYVPLEYSISLLLFIHLTLYPSLFEFNPERCKNGYNGGNDNDLGETIHIPQQYKLDTLQP